MVRTVVSLDERDKQWLDRKARETGVPITALVRQAVRELRIKGNISPAAKSAFEEILRITKGTWRKGDAVSWVRKLRRK